MSPGFFLCLAENTGDGFAYVVLPGKDYKDISLHRNPVTLVRCVVRSRDLTSSIAPRCMQDDVGFKFYTSKGVELFGEEELSPASDCPPPGSDVQMSEEDTNLEEQTHEVTPDASTLPQSSHCFMSLDKQDLSTIVEDDPLAMTEELCETSEELAAVDPCGSPTAVPTPVVTKEPPVHIPLVSQTQSDDENDPQNVLEWRTLTKWPQH